MVLTAVAAAIVAVVPDVRGEEVTWNVLVPIALVAFQSCGQAVSNGALKSNALTSVVLTGLSCDPFSDEALFIADNAGWNRRVGAPILLLIGGAGCGWLFANSEVGIAGALWTAAILKLFIAVSWIFWPAEPSSTEEWCHATRH